MKTKTPYRIRNWSTYNAALIARGSLTLWVDEEAVQAWRYPGPPQRGAQYVYAEAAINCVLTLRAVYHLALRATEGLARSVFALLEVALPVPSYSTLSRRAADLSVVLGALPRSTPLHLVIDASGFKVALADLLQQVPGEIRQVSTDGAYDKRHCYDALAERGAKAVIPPRRDAKIWQHGNCAGAPWQRDENLRAIRHKGRRRWKQESGYHRRSLAETTCFRIKTIFGPRVSSRHFPQQATELFIRVAALNRMTHLGMPDSYPLAA
jgi:transposase